MTLHMSDVRTRMRGRDAIVRLRNQVETAHGETLASLVDEINKLAGQPAPPPNADAIVPFDRGTAA